MGSTIVIGQPDIKILESIYIVSIFQRSSERPQFKGGAIMAGPSKPPWGPKGGQPAPGGGREGGGRPDKGTSRT